MIALALALFAIPSAFAKNNDSAQIKALENERLQALTKLVEILRAQYLVGTIDCDAVIGVEGDFLDVQLATSSTAESRAALLAGVIKEQEKKLYRMANFSEAANQADVEWFRALLLRMKIEGLDKTAGASEIAALRAKRIAALQKLVTILEAQYRIGTTAGSTLLQGEDDLTRAQGEPPVNLQERTTSLAEAIKREQRFVDETQERLKKGLVEQTDFDRAKAQLLATQFKLLKLQAKQDAAKINVLALERANLAEKIAERSVTQYKTDKLSCDVALHSEQALIAAQFDATEDVTARSEVLAQAVKKGEAFLKLAENRFEAGAVSEADVLRAKKFVLSAKIDQLRNSSPRKSD
jgi:hypothetical protein